LLLGGLAAVVSVLMVNQSAAGDLGESWESRCVGRYIAELPASTRSEVPADRMATAVYDDVSITVGWDEGVDELARSLRRHWQTMRELIREDGMDGFVDRRDLSDGGKLVVSVSRSTPPGELDYRLHMPRADAKRAYNLEHSAAAEKREETVARLKEMAHSIEMRAPADIPDEPGFCFVKSFIPDDGQTRDYEAAFAQAKVGTNEQWATASIRVSSAEVREGILKSSKRQRWEWLAKRSPLRLFRWGRREAAGLAGGEYGLYRGDREPAVYKLRWQPSPVPGESTRKLSAKMAAHEAFDEATLLRAWDQLLSNIRHCKVCRNQHVDE